MKGMERILSCAIVSIILLCLLSACGGSKYDGYVSISWPTTIGELEFVIPDKNVDCWKVKNGDFICPFNEVIEYSKETCPSLNSCNHWTDYYQIVYEPDGTYDSDEFRIRLYQGWSSDYYKKLFYDQEGYDIQTVNVNGCTLDYAITNWKNGSVDTYALVAYAKRDDATKDDYFYIETSDIESEDMAQQYATFLSETLEIKDTDSEN